MLPTDIPDIIRFSHPHVTGTDIVRDQMPETVISQKSINIPGLTITDDEQRIPLCQSGEHLTNIRVQDSAPFSEQSVFFPAGLHNQSISFLKRHIRKQNGSQLLVGVTHIFLHRIQINLILDLRMVGHNDLPDIGGNGSGVP